MVKIKNPKTKKKPQAKREFLTIANQTQKLFRSKNFKYLASGLAIIIVLTAGALIYLNINDNEYPILSESKYLEVENALRDAINYSKTEPDKAIQVLENYGTLPKLLENRRHYILSKLYYQIGDPAMAFIHAYEIDRDYITKYSCFYKVKLAERIGLEGVVIDELEFLTDKFPKEPKFQYELAKSYSRQTQLEEAQKLFLGIQKSFPSSEYATGADYYLANITGDKDEKIARMKSYLEKSPEGNLAYLISDQILRLDKADQAKFSDLTNYIAISYYHQGNYSKALEFFNTKYNNPDLYLKAYVDTLLRLDHQEEAENLLINRLPEVHDKVKAGELLDDLLKLCDRITALQYLEMLSNQMPIIKDKILWEIARRSKQRGDFEAVYNQFPDSNYAAESMASVFWLEYKLENFDDALKIYRSHWDKYTDARSHSFVAFWAGKIYIKLNQIDKAREVFNNLIIEHTHDYYSYRSKEILNKEKKWFKQPESNQFVSIPDWKWPEVYSRDSIKTAYGADILELCDIGEYRFVLEQGEHGNLKLDKDMKMWLYAKVEEYPEAINIAYSSIKRNAKVEYDDIRYHYAYPMPYADLIADEVSTSLKLDPLLVQALIKQESYYQKDIVSPVGAVGLMQVMPYTAKSLALEMDLNPPQAVDLMKPELNIKLGVRYLENVLAKFDNNMIYAIASYNAGPDAVKSWTEKIEPDMDLDEFVEKIPYAETKDYVKKVLANFWTYKQLYS